jgi:hypothetical protein
MVEQAGFLGSTTGTQRLQPIRVRGFSKPDRQEVEARTIAQVEANPERYLAAYEKLPQSFEGRYVSADLFKETFDEFSQSREARGRYNAPVHNTAAVLSAAQFDRALAQALPSQTHVVFLTGIPGAGKTSTILRGGELPGNMALVFEGQLINPQTSIEKIGKVIEVGKIPWIVAVHPTPENALDNTLQRFVEYGRGAGLGIMADIQGSLPQGLQAVYEKIGNQVILEIIDVRDRKNVQTHVGWDNLSLLQSEGNRERIYQRLEAALNSIRDQGRLTDAAYEQAYGRVLDAGAISLVRASEQGDRRDGLERGSAQGSGKAAILAG